MPKTNITPPKLDNSPKLDIIATNRQPLLSFFNSQGGVGKLNYEIQLDTSLKFNSNNRIGYKSVKPSNDLITSKLIEEKHQLKDKKQYFWRVRAVDQKGDTSDWAESRFFMDTKSDDSFMGMTRVPVQKVKASSGFNVKNIIDWDDPGEGSFWQATPPGSFTKWLEFDLGRPRLISRIWMLSALQGPDNWLKSFVWQKSSNGKNWSRISGTDIENNNTFRNIIDIKPTKARYLRLVIDGWHGYAPQINEIIFYSPGRPPVPKVPNQPYVLVVGNQHNGFTFSELAAHIEGTGLGLKTITVPRYEVSLDMVKKLRNRPVAIVLSGNNADYPNQPMFEYNGEFEIIRGSDIPILGICCGHQMLCAAYGYTYIGSMGWSDISSMRLEDHLPLSKIKIKKPNDPIFENIPDNFTAPEVHGWSVLHVPKEYQVIAESDYVQAIRHKTKLIYGKQFHAEIKATYNQGVPYIKNFLKLALKN
ncbi:discoidin domain-containing protein [Patescibacteria group bacterium]|nr:discoidin domain-containing protein [Patescibacteria group bacterium]MBU1673531.1 discoidin domain-containing protein [Patescibacteria group bacterium]MBU1963715.1 discoidin domain-containing protein [Patescibacteria group bacterium]